MKVIDEKGKLFGKLNIIDLLVIILILAAIVVVGLKVLGPSDGGPAGTKVTYTVRMTAQNKNVVEEIAKYVDAETGKRDQIVSNGNLMNGYVVDFWTEPTTYNRIMDQNLTLLDPEEASAAGLVDICFLLEAEITNTITSEVGSQQVRVGRTYIVKTTHFEFDCGFVESCTWEPAA